MAHRRSMFDDRRLFQVLLSEQRTLKDKYRGNTTNTSTEIRINFHQSICQSVSCLKVYLMYTFQIKLII